MVYASYAQQHPDMLKIVGVADPIEGRRQLAAQTFGLTADQCFASADDLARRGKIADAVINGTMDADHVPTSLPLLAAGYDMLLEKPFAVTEEEVHQLAAAARRHNRRVMICHVLRYAPFYYSIRQRLTAGEIGELINVQTNEHVSYHHMGVAYIRGKWRRKDLCGSPILMAKCCHDLDLIMWMKSGVRPTRVGSFGSLMYFRADKAPKHAGTQCLVDCPIEKDCEYSARKNYLDHPRRWRFYVWAGLEHIAEPTDAQREAYLKQPDTIFGRCVWKCDNDVVDHQSVAIEFADGATATHNLVCGTARPLRSIYLLGTHGEIQGTMEDSKFTIRHADPRPGTSGYTEEVVDLKIGGDMTGAFGGHGGGDMRLVEDWVHALMGRKPSIACTTIDDSLNGHLVCFAADQAMTERRVVNVSPA